MVLHHICHNNNWVCVLVCIRYIWLFTFWKFRSSV